MTTKRPYVSPLRSASAAHTRDVILERATELFARDGYGRVTVAQIAAAAGVSPKTVFASVGSKSDILNRIVDRAVARSGHDQVVAHILSLDSFAAVIGATSHGTRLGNQRQFQTQEAIRKALPVHEDGDALWERATDAYRDALHAIAEHLHAVSPILLPHPARHTGDLLWLWFGPDAWRTLVVDCGWSWDQAEAGLGRTALSTLGALGRGGSGG